jgi:hypothetical protein
LTAAATGVPVAKMTSGSVLIISRADGALPNNKNHPELKKLKQRSDRAGEAGWRATAELVQTVPTTASGVQALVRTVETDKGTLDMRLDDDRNCRDAFLRTIHTAMERIVQQQRGAASACPALCTAQHLICFLDSYVTIVSLLTSEGGCNGLHREPQSPDTLIVAPPVIRFVHPDFGGTGVRLPGAF